MLMCRGDFFALAGQYKYEKHRLWETGGEYESPGTVLADSAMPRSSGNQESMGTVPGDSKSALALIPCLCYTSIRRGNASRLFVVRENSSKFSLLSGRASAII